MPAGVSAWTPLANLTLTGTASSVTFSSISQSYRDLVIVVYALGVGGSVRPVMRFNGDTGSNYSFMAMQGTGSVASRTFTTSSSYMPEDGSVFGSTTDRVHTTINIFDYSVTDKHKPMLQKTDASATGTTVAAGRWANTAAVTSVAIFPIANSWAAGSSFALYGVAS